MFKSALSRVMSTDASLASLVLRVPTGITFMAHGSQKLFAAFGGYGLEGTGQWMASMGIEPGYLMALLSGSGEFFGGLAILIGLLTRPAAAVLVFTMLIAILTVHIGNGLFMSNNGFEYALALLTIAASLMITGGGKLSLDRVLQPGSNAVRED
ncbi:MAG: DoxX family protein [Cobetia marina]